MKGIAMRYVKEILKSKVNEVWSISPDATAFEALQVMAEKGIGALLVMDGEKVAGIFSERDYARKVILTGKSSMNTPVSDIMTSDVLYVQSDQSLEDCMVIMSEKHVRHLPVFEEEKLTGIISIGDIVKGIIAEKEYIINQLEHYIHGKF